MTRLLLAMAATCLVAGAAAAETCKAQAEAKKLHRAAETSFTTKCEKDANCSDHKEWCVDGLCQQCRPGTLGKNDCPAGKECKKGRCEAHRSSSRRTARNGSSHRHTLAALSNNVASITRRRSCTGRRKKNARVRMRKVLRIESRSW